MKNALIAIAITLFAYFSYTTFFAASTNEQVLENSFQQMTNLDQKDLENNISEDDVSIDTSSLISNTSKQTEVDTQTIINIDTVISDISAFSGIENVDPFEGI